MWNAFVGTRSHRVTKIASPESLQCFCVCTDGKLTPLSCTFAALFVCWIDPRHRSNNPLGVSNTLQFLGHFTAFSPFHLYKWQRIDEHHIWQISKFEIICACHCTDPLMLSHPPFLITAFL